MRRPPLGLGRLVDRGLHLVLVAHVALDERDAELGGERLALLRVDVGDDDVRAVARAARRAVASPRPDAPPETSAPAPSIFMRDSWGRGAADVRRSRRSRRRASRSVPARIRIRTSGCRQSARASASSSMRAAPSPIRSRGRSSSRSGRRSRSRSTSPRGGRTHRRARRRPSSRWRRPCLARRHPDRAVEADRLAVEHHVLDDVRSELRVLFAAPAQAAGERHLLARARRARPRGAPASSGVSRESRRDRADADPLVGEVARGGEGHARRRRPWSPSRRSARLPSMPVEARRPTRC